MEPIIIDGHYRLERELRHGGNGVIYYGTDMRLGRPVAVKRVLPHMGIETGNAALLDEARVIARLQHPGITQVYDLREADDGGIYIIMEYVDGRDVRSVLKERGALNPGVAAYIAVRVCEALQYAHTAVNPADGMPLRIVHRDITPANVMLTRTGGVKLIDFGIARHEAREQDLTMTGTLKGTVAYMSPEQVRGERDLDGRTDLFSLGAVFYEMLSGEKLFGGTGLSDYQQMQQVETVDVDLEERCREQDIPGALCPVLEACLARDRNDRYADADAMRAALAAVMDDDSVSGTIERLRTLAAGEEEMPGIVDGSGTTMLERTVVAAAPDAPTVTLQRDPVQPDVPVPAQKPEQNNMLLALLSVVTVVVAGGGAMLWPTGKETGNAGGAPQQVPVVRNTVPDTVPLFNVTLKTVPQDAVLHTADGTVRIDGHTFRLPARDTVFLARKRGYRDARCRLAAADIKRGNAVSVTLQPLVRKQVRTSRKKVLEKKKPVQAVRALTVTVKNGTFAPLPGATVVCTGKNSTAVRRRAGSGGNAEFELVEGGYALSVTCPGYRAYEKRITVDAATRPVTVMLYDE